MTRSKHNRRSRAEIREEIRAVLLREWDPIGIGDELDAREEYDAYVDIVYAWLDNGVSAERMAEWLFKTEVELAGVPDRPIDLASAQRIAVLLKGIDIHCGGDERG